HPTPTEYPHGRLPSSSGARSLRWRAKESRELEAHYFPRRLQTQHGQETAKSSGPPPGSRKGVFCKWANSGGGRGIRTPKGLAARWISSSQNERDYRARSGRIGIKLRLFANGCAATVTVFRR